MNRYDCRASPPHAKANGPARQSGPARLTRAHMNSPRFAPPHSFRTTPVPPLPSKIFSGKCWRRGEKTKRPENIFQTYLAIYRAWPLKHIVQPTAVILFIVLKSKTRDVPNLVPRVSPSVIWER